MVDVKLGNLTFEGVDSVKLNTTDGGEVVFTLGGGEVDSGGTIVNPDKSGVIKLDLNNMCDYRLADDGGDRHYFKLPDEAFRVNPDEPIPFSRIGAMKWRVNPFASWGKGEYTEFSEALEETSHITSTYSGSGFEYAYANLAENEAEFLRRVTVDVFEEYGVSYPKGFYAICDYFVLVEIEILAP